MAMLLEGSSPKVSPRNENRCKKYKPCRIYTKSTMGRKSTSIELLPSTRRSNNVVVMHVQIGKFTLGYLCVRIRRIVAIFPRNELFLTPRADRRNGGCAATAAAGPPPWFERRGRGSWRRRRLAGVGGRRAAKNEREERDQGGPRRRRRSVAQLPE